MQLTEETAKRLIDALQDFTDTGNRLIDNFSFGFNISDDDRERIDQSNEAMSNLSSELADFTNKFAKGIHLAPETNDSLSSLIYALDNFKK